jgi:peptidoglycan hydrolase CwlO-like protein
MSVLVEEMNGKLNLLAEGQSVLREKVVSLETKVDSLETKADLLAEDMDYVKSNLLENKNRFGEVDEALENKVEKEAFLGHENRLSALEKASLA